MNKVRRKQIKEAINYIEQNDLDKAKDILTDVLFEEEMAFDNMPEGLQSSQRGMDSEEAIDVLNEVIDMFDENETDGMVEMLTDIAY